MWKLIRMESYIRVNGKMVNKMVMVKKFGRMEPNIMVNLKMVFKKVMVNELYPGVKKSTNFMEIV